VAGALGKAKKDIVIMIFMRMPKGEQIKELIEQQSRMPFSYPDLEATRGPAPPGYAVDHNRVQVGRGEVAYQRARMALLRWRMFELSWVQLCWPNIPVQTDNTVGLLARVAGSWWMNVCRIVYTFDEAGEMERLGFAYGTLPEHAAMGEERYTVEWHHADDTVWYEMLGYSKPNHRLARLGGPLARRTQKRFAEDSMRAMVRAVGGRAG
jgi:uncharacterized protein (UPF0548 family)